MSCCDVRGWGVASESDKVNQKTNVQEGARKRERESARERKRERESKYAWGNDSSICIHISIHIYTNK